MAAQPRDAVMAVVERERPALAHLGEPAGVLPVGSTLPDVELVGPDCAPLADHSHPRRRSAFRWIDVHPDYSTRSEAGDIIAALKALSL